MIPPNHISTRAAWAMLWADYLARLKRLRKLRALLREMGARR